MTVKTPKLRIETPTGPLLTGRGFYQLEEESLYVQIAPFDKGRRFFSFLEASNVRLDLDKQGHLLFIEVNLARRHWTVDPDLQPPDSALPADIRWLDFRETIDTPEIFADKRRLTMLLRFSKEQPVGSYLLARNVVVETDQDNNLAAIWITDITDDLAGREISAFRKQTRKELRM